MKKISLVEVTCSQRILLQRTEREGYQEFESYLLTDEHPKVFRRELVQRDAHEPKTLLCQMGVGLRWFPDRRVF